MTTSRSCDAKILDAILLLDEVDVHALRRLFTVGLWMISLVIHSLESGYCLRASYAIWTARSTPQQKP